MMLCEPVAAVPELIRPFGKFESVSERIPGA